MPAPVEPPELARLLDVAERARVDDWSLRSALVRYAQPEPERVARLVEVLRRLELGFRAHHDRLAADGPAVWDALERGVTGDPLVELLRAARSIDELGARVAEWAVDRTAGTRPDAELDTAVAEVSRRLDELGVPREEPAAPGRGGRPRRRG